MPTINFSDDQKSQLVGWLNREKDHMLSVKSMADKIILPGVTGTLELIKQDLEFVIRVRTAIRTVERDDPVELSIQDCETLVDVGRANNYSNRDEFWKSIIASCTRGETMDFPSTESGLDDKDSP